MVPDLRQNLSISMHFVPSFATVLLCIKDGLAFKGISYTNKKDTHNLSDLLEIEFDFDDQVFQKFISIDAKMMLVGVDGFWGLIICVTPNADIFKS